MQRGLILLLLAALAIGLGVGCEQAAPAASSSNVSDAVSPAALPADTLPPSPVAADSAAVRGNPGPAGVVAPDTDLTRRLKELEAAGTVSDLVEKVDLPSHDADGTPIITFEQLAAYRYPRFLDEGEEPPTEADIPDAIRALDGKTVVVSGYMMPTKLRNGKVEKFMLVPNTLACCYGKPLELNEWVNVDMTGKATEAVPDVRIAVRGLLRVGENKIDGWVMDLYRMDADRVRIQDGF